MATILIRTTLVSQRGGPLAVVVEDFPKTPHQTRDNRNFPRPLRTSVARLRLACPPLARRNGARQEELVEGATRFSALVRRGGGQRWQGMWPPIAPLAGRLHTSTVIPAERLKR